MKTAASAAKKPKATAATPAKRQTRPEPPPEAFDAVATLFRVLSEPMRLRIIRVIEDHGPLSVSEIAARVQTAQPTVSKHLRVLEEAGLVRKRAVGTSVACSIADESLVRLCEAVCDRIRAGLEVRASLLRLSGR